MSQVENLWGGFQSDEAKELQGGNFDGLVFGLNEDVKIAKFEYTTKTGKGGAEGNGALDITLVVNGAEKNTRIYEPGGNGIVYFKGKPVSDQKSEDYLQGLRQGIVLAKGLITHYLKALGYTEEQLSKNLSTATSFQSLCEKAAVAVKKHLNKTPLNLFAHFQASIKGDATQTYLEIPENLAYGAFLTPAYEAKNGSWEAQNEWETEEGKKVKGLRYVDGDGNVHPLQRDENYMKSKRASKQTKEATTNSAFALPTVTTDIAPAGSATSSDDAEDDEWG